MLMRSPEMAGRIAYAGSRRFLLRGRSAWVAPIAGVGRLLVSVAMAVADIPAGMEPREFYDGFFPTEQWVQSLAPIAREQRRNPFQALRAVESLPDDPKARWAGATVDLTRERIEEMEKQAQRFLQLSPERFLGLVPRRNRIAGNQRVMPDGRVVPCPMGDSGRLRWYPDEPDTIHCSRGHTADVFALLPQTGVFKMACPLGDEQQEYPYHDTPDGQRRIFLNGEYRDPLRVHALSQGAADPAMLYRLKGDLEYARRAAAILYDFALAVPHWPKVARGYYSQCEGLERFRPIEDYRAYAGLWYDKSHSGVGGVPVSLALAYDGVVNAPVWEALDRRAKGGDGRAVIENDLFLYTVKDAIRYDIHHPQPSAALSNYIPYQILGLLAIGRAIGLPEAVHYAYWKSQQLARKTLMADGMFPESASYARQHVYGLARAAKVAEGYSAPAGFVSTLDGRRFDDLNMLRDLPELRRGIEALESLVHPNGEYMMFHDT